MNQPCICGHALAEHKQGKRVIVCWIPTCECLDFRPAVKAK